MSLKCCNYDLNISQEDCGKIVLKMKKVDLIFSKSIHGPTGDCSFVRTMKEMKDEFAKNGIDLRVITPDLYSSDINIICRQNHVTWKHAIASFFTRHSALATRIFLKLRSEKTADKILKYYYEIEELEEDMDEILKHFNDLNNQLLDKMYKETADEVMKCIPMKMEQFYEKFDKQCMDIPIFKYYDPFQLFQRISCASNEDIVLIKEKLLDRAEKYTKQLEPEMKNIKQLKQIIDDYVKGKEPTIKTVMLKDFAKEMGYILEKYKPSFLPRKDEKIEIENQETD